MQSFQNRVQNSNSTQLIHTQQQSRRWPGRWTPSWSVLFWMPNFQDQELWKQQSLQRSIKTTDTAHDPPKELSFGALVGVVAGLLVESVAVSLVCLFFDGEIRIVLVGLVVAVHVQQVLSTNTTFSSTLFCNQSNHFNNVLFVHEVILVFFFLVFVFFLFLFLS